MVAVAVVAVVFGWRQRWSHYQRLAEDHRISGTWCVVPKDPVDRELRLRHMAYHDALCRKYERASWLPWLPVAPDPAPPE
jgi:hypothetical protein